MGATHARVLRLVCPADCPEPPSGSAATRCGHGPWVRSPPIPPACQLPDLKGRHLGDFPSGDDTFPSCCAQHADVPRGVNDQLMPHRRPGRASQGPAPCPPWPGAAAAAHLERLVLALGRLHEQVGAPAVAEAVGGALQQQERQRQLGQCPLHPRHRVEQLDAEADFEPCPADQGVRVVDVHLRGERRLSDPREPPPTPCTAPSASDSCRLALRPPVHARGPQTGSASACAPSRKHVIGWRR